MTPDLIDFDEGEVTRQRVRNARRPTSLNKRFAETSIQEDCRDQHRAGYHAAAANNSTGDPAGQLLDTGSARVGVATKLWTSE